LTLRNYGSLRQVDSASTVIAFTVEPAPHAIQVFATLHELRSADFLGEPDENSSRPAVVAEPTSILYWTASPTRNASCQVCFAALSPRRVTSRFHPHHSRAGPIRGQYLKCNSANLTPREALSCHHQSRLNKPTAAHNVSGQRGECALAPVFPYLVGRNAKSRGKTSAAH
jgi:hypothetical protein